MMEKEWLSLGKESFKVKAKINSIQNGLEV